MLSKFIFIKNCEVQVELVSGKDMCLYKHTHTLGIFIHRNKPL